MTRPGRALGGLGDTACTITASDALLWGPLPRHSPRSHVTSRGAAAAQSAWPGAAVTSWWSARPGVSHSPQAGSVSRGLGMLPPRSPRPRPQPRDLHRAPARGGWPPRTLFSDGCKQLAVPPPAHGLPARRRSELLRRSDRATGTDLCDATHRASPSGRSRLARWDCVSPTRAVHRLQCRVSRGWDAARCWRPHALLRAGRSGKPPRAPTPDSTRLSRAVKYLLSTLSAILSSRGTVTGRGHSVPLLCGRTRRWPGCRLPLPGLRWHPHSPNQNLTPLPQWDPGKRAA